MINKPVIWKVGKNVELGQCAHHWAIPFSVPSGLMTECFKCHKTRHVKVEKSITKEQEAWLKGGLQ